MSDDKAILVTRNLTKQFGRLTALHDVTVEARPGEVVCVFGRNGAGKSTLLKILATVIRSYRGEALVFAHDLKRAGGEVRRRIGFVSHDSFLYQDLSVRENLRFYARMFGVTGAAARVDGLIERMGLTHKATAPVRSLSRGLRQRAALARSVVHEPELLLLDEPYTGIDEQAAAGLDALVTEFKDGGGTILMTTHDIERGFRLADRVIVIERGEVAHESAAAGDALDSFRARYHEILMGSVT